MNEKYKPIDRNSFSSDKILADFEVILDVDLAVVHYIATHSKNADILDESIGRAITLSGIRNLLLFRRLDNPLSVCIKKEYWDSIDDIYEELMDVHKAEILKDCQVNDLYNYFKVLLMTNNLVNITINCRDEMEENIIHELLPAATTIINQRDLENYDTLYLKYVSDIVQYKGILKKKIYMINGMYNYDKGMMFKKEILVLIDCNVVSTIDPYENLTIPPVYNLV